jgi:hypothetical protein
MRLLIGRLLINLSTTLSGNAVPKFMPVTFFCKKGLKTPNTWEFNPAVVANGETIVGTK